jgi:hypothetical protein
MRRPRPTAGLAEEDEHYFRDVYDHLIRIRDLIESYRDLLTGTIDVYFSTVSNPNQRGDEAADDHRHHLSAAVVHHRFLRPELRLDGFPRPQRAESTTRVFLSSVRVFAGDRALCLIQGRHEKDAGEVNSDGASAR